MDINYTNRRWIKTNLVFCCKVASLLLVLTGFCPVALAQVSGHVYRDFNGDGIRQLLSSPTEPGLPGVTVSAYLTGNPTPTTTTTDSEGFYSLALPAGQQYRLEFSDFPFESYVGMTGPNSGSSVQFVTSPFTNADLGVSDPRSYCNTVVPRLVAPTYVVGNALATGSNSAGLPTLIRFPYGATGQVNVSESLADAATIGTVWGGVYHRQAEKLIYSAILKRHSSLGTLGLGGIYKADPSGVIPAEPYLDLSKFVSLSSPSDSLLLLNRNLPADFNVASQDSAAFSLVGKVGLGGMAISPDEKTLWVVNLYQKTLVRITIGAPIKPGNQLTGADITSFSIPNPGCLDGQSRPWAVEYHEGSLYVGLTCDAGSPSGTRDNLRAYVYRFDLETMQFISTPVISEALNYRKGWVHALVPQSEYWEPWSDTWNDFTTSLLTTTDGVDVYRISRPQPIFSDIEFDTDGSILIGLMDRTGHQTGRNQLSVPADSNRYSGYIGGDILRAQLNTNGTYTLESNGMSGTRMGSGVGNNEGPGGGEFYGADLYRDVFSNEVIQEETFMGSMVSLPGNNEVIASVIEPFTAWSGGVSWFSNLNGQRIKAYEIYFGDDPAQQQYLGNANGLGALAALCAAAPLQIGNRLWVDTDQDGVQDPNEAPLANVFVALYDESGELISFTQTDANGNYRFQSSTLQPFTTYYIVPGTDGTTSQFNVSAGVLQVNGAAYKLTLPQVGEGANADLNDSDALIASGLPAALNGRPVITVTTGAPGQNNLSLDAGFIDCWVDAGADATVCEGTTTYQLTAAEVGQTWIALGGNPSAATINASGQVSGLQSAGTYRFVLEQGITCRDTVQIVVNASPQVTAVIESATCANFSTNNNGQIKLTGFTPQDRFNYSPGSTFSSPVYDSPQPIPLSGVLVNDLQNPTTPAQFYSVRLTNTSGCEQNLVLTLQQVNCNCEGIAKICLPITAQVLKRP